MSVRKKRERERERETGMGERTREKIERDSGYERER